MANAKLTVLTGDLKGAEVHLRDGELTIGRGTDDLVLPDEIVSRLQATLSFAEGKYLLRDENSRNGTFINDRKITEQVLRDGDVIEFGLGGPSARFEVQIERQSAARAGPAPGSVDLSATPLQAATPDEDPDAWIDRGRSHASTGMFQTPPPMPEPAPESRSPVPLWGVATVAVLVLLVALVLMLTGGV